MQKSETNKNIKLLDIITQVALPTMTIGAQIAIALKYPQYGLLINLAVQPFWLYSSWKAMKEAKQYGIFLTAFIFTIVTILGIINYWLI